MKGKIDEGMVYVVVMSHLINVWGLYSRMIHAMPWNRFKELLSFQCNKSMAPLSYFMIWHYRIGRMDRSSLLFSFPVSFKIVCDTCMCIASVQALPLELIIITDKHC